MELSAVQRGDNIHQNSKGLDLKYSQYLCVNQQGLRINKNIDIKMIFWFHFHKLRYANYRLSIVSIIAM